MNKEHNKDVKKIKIAFLGLGVIGTGLMDIICANRECLRAKKGVEIEFGKILVRDLNKKRNIAIKDLDLTNDPDDIVSDDSIDIIVDCMGGIGVQRTRDIILSALEKRKAVVMSSKKCLAMYGNEIIEGAIKNKVKLRYDASVGGCIPINSMLTTMARGEKIERIYGIFNATSNYIYTVMNEKSISYEDALEQAQLKGYAENNPAEDVEGFDALFKLVILVGFGMKKWIDYKVCRPVPMAYVGENDFKVAKRCGYVIKPMSIAQLEDEVVSYYVGPCLVRKDSMLSEVKQNNNMIIVESDWSGQRAFYGQGAGARPTASAMFDDIMSIIENKGEDSYELLEIKQEQNISEWRGNFFVRIRGDVNYETLKDRLREKSVEIENMDIRREVYDNYTEVIVYNTWHKELEEVILSVHKNKEILIDTIMPYIEV